MVQTSCIKPKLLIISGPTASGKSSVAVRAAQEFDGEIVSCDSMQIYKGMNIGTGKINPAEQCGVPHYLLDIVYPGEEFSVSDYRNAAEKCLNDIWQRGKLPILVGGTGLYIDAVLNGLNFSAAPKSEAIRSKWKKIAEEQGVHYLHEQLRQVDALSADKINPNDVKRVIRALEIYDLTGIPKSSQATCFSSCPYNFLFLVLDPDREVLYDQINQRVDAMVTAGLEQEVLSLLKFRNTQAMQAIGYKEFFAYFDGNATLAETIERIKQNSRRYAKRQITFLKGMPAEKYFIAPNYQTEIRPKIENFIKDFI